MLRGTLPFFLEFQKQTLLVSLTLKFLFFYFVVSYILFSRLIESVDQISKRVYSLDEQGNLPSATSHILFSQADI